MRIQELKAFDESDDTDVRVIDVNGGPLTKISDYVAGRATASRSIWSKASQRAGESGHVDRLKPFRSR